MVQADILTADILRVGLERQRYAMEEFGGSIADADDANLGVMAYSLRNQPRRIGEIDHPRLRAEALDLPRIFDCRLGCAQSHRNAAWPRRLLPRIPVFNGPPFVDRAGLHATHT